MREIVIGRERRDGCRTGGRICARAVVVTVVPMTEDAERGATIRAGRRDEDDGEDEETARTRRRAGLCFVRHGHLGQAGEPHGVSRVLSHDRRQRLLRRSRASAEQQWIPL